ncbi:MAG: bifunctional phosphoribosyl-AMP cyclohydrolase/phosphoribosyl-ATP diphosphatase HisIE [Eubacteriales bacterium]|nr:bifunctional phosphoribosyl-AMP cyclohydrolase/phosphoribosyl-ATP diphosphatase HisIE [Eubacteriales bacterium]
MDLTKYFTKAALIPTIIQDQKTKKVLMLAYMNEESLGKTIETGFTWFFSRSRNELWNKGATSGHVQKVISITGDCDDDTLLIEVEQTGPACHTGAETCFYQESGIAEFRTKGELAEAQRRKETAESSDGLKELYQVVLDRRRTFAEDSYTCYLFEKGLDKILKKCGEECSEVIIAAKNYAAAAEDVQEGTRLDLKNELCDLLYHLTVLMVNEEIELEEINEILKQRSHKIGNLKIFRNSDHNS